MWVWVWVFGVDLGVGFGCVFWGEIGRGQVVGRLVGWGDVLGRGCGGKMFGCVFHVRDDNATMERIAIDISRPFCIESCETQYAIQGQQ